VETYIKLLARQIGLVRSLLVPDELAVVKGYADRPAGLASYAFVVPGKGTIKVSLSHPNEGWLRMGMVDKEGHPEKGMVPNLVDNGRLEVSFQNPRDEVRVVHVLVDDPGWMSSRNSLYALKIERDWNIGKVEPGSFKREHGIWAIVDPVFKIEGGAPSEVGVNPGG
jgi:hypothetical protein